MKVWVLHEVNDGGHSNYHVFQEDHPPSSERLVLLLESWGNTLKYASMVSDHLKENNEWSDIDTHISLKLVEVE